MTTGRVGHGAIVSGDRAGQTRTDPTFQPVGFIQPNHPDLDLPTWRRGTRQERMRPLVRHFCEVGFGSPDAVTLVYLVKIVLYVLVGWLFVLSTPGIDGFRLVSDWWRAPVVFYKFVLWTMLFEVLGLGLRLRPAQPAVHPTARLVPLLAAAGDDPAGAVARPGAADRGRLAHRRRRRAVRRAASPRCRRGVRRAAALAGRRSSLGRSPLIGLRDKVIFLAARSEVYGDAGGHLPASSAGDPVVAAKLVMVAIWWGAATSKLNRHFPFVVAAMKSNSPIWRREGIKRRFHRDFPDDLRPSGSRRRWRTAARSWSSASRCCSCSATAGSSRRSPPW